MGRRARSRPQGWLRYFNPRKDQAKFSLAESASKCLLLLRLVPRLAGFGLLTVFTNEKVATVLVKRDTERVATARWGDFRLRAGRRKAIGPPEDRAALTVFRRFSTGKFLSKFNHYVGKPKG